MITTIVIKAIRAGNLRCPYCYYINDSTPQYGTSISEECVQKLYSAYADYASMRESVVDVVWHGGEPLLLGKRKFQRFLDLQRKCLPSVAVA